MHQDLWITEGRNEAIRVACINDNGFKVAVAGFDEREWLRREPARAIIEAKIGAGELFGGRIDIDDCDATSLTSAHVRRLFRSPPNPYRTDSA